MLWIGAFMPRQRHYLQWCQSRWRECVKLEMAMEIVIKFIEYVFIYNHAIFFSLWVKYGISPLLMDSV